MNQINPKKLLHSKWTAVSPIRKAKHFIITELEFNDENEITECRIEAVLTKSSELIDWRELKNSQVWKYGWK